jgi:hypothetical protein
MAEEIIKDPQAPEEGQQAPEEDDAQNQRERFDQEVIRRVFDFASDLIQDVPELEVLTVMPAWGIPQENLMPAMYITRDGTGMSPHDILLVTDRMVRALEFQTNKFRELMMAAGDTADQQARIIHERQTLIEEKEKTIEDLGRKLAELEKLSATVTETSSEEQEA